MADLARFGVSLEEDLLSAFDSLCSKRGYGSRSEAIRDLIRAELGSDLWGKGGPCSGCLTLVYDHHRHDLARRIMAIQHDFHELIIATMHVHLDHDNCLETLTLKGEGGRVEELAQKLISCKGVKYGVFNHVPESGSLA